MLYVETDKSKLRLMVYNVPFELSRGKDNYLKRNIGRFNI
jgi:hypothetical protein